MYTYNRIHNDYDNNVVRVELNTSYRPRRSSRATSRESIRVTSPVNRNDTFTKGDQPSNIIRSETFILKHHQDESSDERPDYNTYTRSKKKSYVPDEKKHDDKSNYATYTRSEKKGSGNEKSRYINTDTYRKSSKSRSSVSAESENLNTNTFTKSTKPKRVESLIKRFDMSFWRRNKEPKEKSPSPSGSDTIKRSKNIFNLITSGKKSTRDIGIECKMDEDRDYYYGMGTRKSSIQSLLPEKKHRPMKGSQRNENQQLTSIIKSPERRNPYYENAKKSTTPVPAPIRVEVGLRNVNKYTSDAELRRKPIGIASPLPQARNRSALKKSYDNKRPEITRSYAPTRGQEPRPRVQETRSRVQETRSTVQETRLKVPESASNFTREGSERTSFRDYRERLRLKNDNRRITDNSDDELRKSYQQSFFVPM